MSISADQLLFNKALDHIRKQGKPAMRNHSCAYRGRGNTSCAFAPAIADYSEDLEGSSAADLLVQQPDVLYPWARTVDEGLANDIQAAHDGNAESSNNDNFLTLFESTMAKIANKYGLIYSTSTQGA